MQFLATTMSMFLVLFFLLMGGAVANAQDTVAEPTAEVVVVEEEVEVDFDPLLSTLKTEDVYAKEIDPYDIPLEFIFGEKSYFRSLNDFMAEDESTLDPERIYEIAFITRSSKSAEVILNEEGNLEIMPEKLGMRIDMVDLTEKLQNAYEMVDTSAILVSYEYVPPKLYSSELEEFLPSLEALLDKELKLTSQSTPKDANGKTYTFKLRDNFDLLDVKLAHFLEWGDSRIPVSLITDDSIAKMALKKDWHITLNEQKVDQYIVETMSEDLELQSRDVTIAYDEEGNVTFEGAAENGIQVDRSDLIDLMVAELQYREPSEDKEGEEAADKSEIERNSELGDMIVSIPLKEVKGAVNVPEDMKENGITELVSTGYSNFVGSSWKRVHNINTGIGKYNGLVIKKGETFSFNEHLGPVDASTGYHEELVIKGAETKPEYGGGLCQVSSTFFRAGLFGGLTIPERAPHSYAVSYYARPGGHGLDCTIYPGVKDCKILNDTPGDILIQAYTDGNDAYFKFYGTSDGRSVDLEGPYYSNHTGAPPDKIIYDASYPEGYEEIKEQPHNGFDAVWHRTITLDDGTEEKETFYSHYQARPKVILRGGTEPTDDE